MPLICAGEGHYFFAAYYCAPDLIKMPYCTHNIGVRQWQGIFIKEVAQHILFNKLWLLLDLRAELDLWLDKMSYYYIIANNHG